MSKHSVFTIICIVDWVFKHFYALYWWSVTVISFVSFLTRTTDQISPVESIKMASENVPKRVKDVDFSGESIGDG